MFKNTKGTFFSATGSKSGASATPSQPFSSQEAILQSYQRVGEKLAHRSKLRIILVGYSPEQMEVFFKIPSGSSVERFSSKDCAGSVVVLGGADGTAVLRLDTKKEDAPESLRQFAAIIKSQAAFVQRDPTLTQVWFINQSAVPDSLQSLIEEGTSQAVVKARSICVPGSFSSTECLVNFADISKVCIRSYQAHQGMVAAPAPTVPVLTLDGDYCPDDERKLGSGL